MRPGNKKTGERSLRGAFFLVRFLDGEIDVTILSLTPVIPVTVATGKSGAAG